MNPDIEKKMDFIAKSIKSQITKECQINEKSIDEIQKIVKEDFSTYENYEWLRYIRNDKEYLIVNSFKRRVKIIWRDVLMVTETTKSVQQNSTFSTVLKGMREFFGKYDQATSDKINDYRYPKPYKYFFVGKYLAKCYRIRDQVTNDFQFIFNADEVKQENYPYIKYLDINTKFYKFEEKRVKIYKQIVQNSKNLTHLIIDLNSLQEQININSLISLLNECQQIFQLKLVIPLNKIEKKDIEKLSNVISTLQNLNTLKYNIIQDEQKCGIELLNFKNNFQQLTQIDLCYRYLQYGCLNVNSIGYLSKFTNLQVLNLNFAENQIKEEGAISLFESIGKLKNLTKASLNLYQNEIGHKSCSVFEQNISKCTELVSLQLNLKDTEISQNDIILILNGVKNCKLLNSFNIYLALRDRMIAKLRSQFETVFKNLVNLHSFFTDIQSYYYHDNVEFKKFNKTTIFFAKRLVIFSLDDYGRSYN